MGTCQPPIELNYFYFYENFTADTYYFAESKVIFGKTISVGVDSTFGGIL